jgi:hypothetical protein
VFLIIRNVVLLLVVVFTLSFILIDIILFSGSSEKSIGQISLNGEILTEVVRSLYLSRDAVSAPNNKSISLLAASGRSLRALLAREYATLSSDAQRNWFDNSDIRISVAASSSR